MKKIVKIFAIICTILCMVSGVYASSFDIKAEPESVVSKAGETIEFNIYIENIDMNAKGINVIEGFIQYDEESIESIELINENDWKTKYNSNKGEELYGKFLSIKEVDGITQKENFIKMKVKIKDEINNEKSYISLKELTSNDGENLVNIGNKEIEIKFEKDENENVNGNGNEKDKKEETKEENKAEDVKQSNIKTGDILPLVAVGTIFAIIILNTLISMRKKRR